MAENPSKNIFFIIGGSFSNIFRSMLVFRWDAVTLLLLKGVFGILGNFGRAIDELTFRFPFVDEEAGKQVQLPNIAFCGMNRKLTLYQTDAIVS